MTCSPELGAPTSYGFRLPMIRHELCRPFLSDERTAELVDYGCGNGANTILFAPDAARVRGFDVEAARVAEATAELATAGADNVTYDVYDGRRLPLDDASVDVVTSFEVLEHTDDDGAALQDIARVLRPGGRLLISVPNKYYLMETHGFALPGAGWIPWNRVPFLNLAPGWFYRRFGNARIYSERAIRRLLADAGFVVDEVSYIKPPLDIVSGGRAKRLLERVIRALPERMGVSIFLSCRRVT